MAADYVDDEELLYRRVFPEHILLSDGTHQIHSQAFTDRYRQPSVDRARLCGNDPTHTQQQPGFGVISVRAFQVRQIVLIQRDPAVQEVVVRPFDVKPDPLPDNPAHAVIYTIPEFDSQRTFRKLLDRLKHLGEIVLLPREGA